MALFQISLFSGVLRRETMVSVVLPDGNDTMDDFRTLYLFHGAGGNHLDWIRHTHAEQLAEQYGTALVMPAADLGFYTDMHMGSRYFTYISRELPEYVQRMLPLSKEREKNFVAGLSMGGYGAMKLAMTYPERFCAAASMSGVLDAAGLMRNKALTKEIELDGALAWCFGNEEGAERQENSLARLMEKNAAEGRELPGIYQCVGTEDFLYDLNRSFYKRALELGISVTYEEGPGMHEWGYWRQQLPKVFAWMFGKQKNA